LVRSDLRKRKALEWLIEHVEIVDEQGNPIDRSALRVEDEVDEVSTIDGDAPDPSSPALEPVAPDGTAIDPQSEPQTDAAATDAKLTEEPE
jgi:hypothetical protein